MTKLYIASKFCLRFQILNLNIELFQRSFILTTFFLIFYSSARFFNTINHDFSFIFTDALTVSFVACCILAVTTCLPTKRSPQSWPCQRDKDVRTLLSDASSMSLTLARKISVLSNIMVREAIVLLRCYFVT